jgi:hypothetical protein
MIAEREERLIQDVLEGDAAPAQVAELKRLLETNPEFRARHEEMSGVFRLLAESRDVVPLATLHGDIMSAIAAEPSPGAGAPSRGQRSRRTLAPVFGAFLAGAAAASLIVVAVLRGPHTGRLDGAPASGTLAPVPAPGTLVSQGSIVVPGGHIELATRRAGDDVRLELHAVTSRPVDLECDFPQEALGLTGLRWSRPPAGPWAVKGGRVTLGFTTSGDLVLTFTARGPGDTPVRVRAIGAREVLLHTAPQ